MDGISPLAAGAIVGFWVLLVVFFWVLLVIIFWSNISKIRTKGGTPSGRRQGDAGPGAPPEVRDAQRKWLIGGHKKGR